MAKKLVFFLFVCVGTCLSQSGPAVKPDFAGCQTLEWYRPWPCPNRPCSGSYPQYQSTPGCTVSGAPYCVNMQPTTWCCGAYQSYYILDYCIFTDLQREPMRSRILELAKERDLIVPTCGAYAPARMVLRPDEERSHGGS